MNPNFVNRELSWIDFNQRVLNEAIREDLPLLDRVKFLAITDSNLDEFFQVRVGGLQTLKKSIPRFTDHSGHDVSEVLAKIEMRARRFTKDQGKLFRKKLLPSLHEAGLGLTMMSHLTAKQESHLRSYFKNSVAPLLTPLHLSGDKALDLVPSLAVCIAFRILDPKENETRVVIIPLPANVPRLITLKKGGFVLLEDLISHFSTSLFPEEKIIELTVFRLTRNTDIPANENGTHDFAEEIRAVVTDRIESLPVRLQLSEDNELTQELISLLRVDIPKVFLSKTPLALTDFFQLALAEGFSHLRTPPIVGVGSPEIDSTRSLFETISEKDAILVHPYQSYLPVLRFLEEASSDPQVLAIKQVLYRTAKNSKIVDSLIRAAKSGKQVTVIVEIKARFDEVHNLDRAVELRRAGAQVIYGVRGLKTHAKITQIIRQEEGQLRSYVHLSTGNYNEVTAGFYTDISYFTAKPEFGDDATLFFNAVTGKTKLEGFRALIPAPSQMKRVLLDLIEKETAHALDGEEAHIMAKMNSLEDIDMIEALYQASKAGVKIQLNVRGICCLKTGERKEAKNIEVISIVDQQLEHMRIFSFHQGGDRQVFISSADWMRRNLSKRVELMTPIRDAHSKKLLIGVLEACFRDNQNAFVIQPDGTSRRREPQKGERKFRMQEHLQKLFALKASTAEQAKSSTLTPHLPKDTE